MLKDLRLLFNVTSSETTLQEYQNAVVDENALLKPSMQTRRKTLGFLRDRYALDPDVPLFRTLRMLAIEEPTALPLLAMLVSVARDPVLRATTRIVADAEPGVALSSKGFAKAIADAFPERLSAKTLEASGERATATWIQAGHLTPGPQRIRRRVDPTSASATLALLLGSLSGASGERLLTSTWTKLIDGTPQAMLAHARHAAQHGWLEYRHAGGILEITFRKLAPEIEAQV